MSEKIVLFRPKNLGWILIPPFNSNFFSQNDWIFSLGALKEKLSHFDLKSRVEFLFRQWLKF